MIKYLTTEIVGGLGNQLFMISNLISLGKKYNRKIKVSNVFNDNNRKTPKEYNIFKNVVFSDVDNDLEIYYEKEYKYNNIFINEDKDYKLIGYFQSYKYFWDQKDELKKIFNIDFSLIDNLKEKLIKYDKIVAVHIRLRDYVEKSRFHYNLDIEYYKKALNNFNEDYTIILFSDDYEKARELLGFCKNVIVQAEDITNGDENEFYLLSIIEQRILSNSTYCLWSTYLNEIFNFVENPKYFLPNKWFENDGPIININDLIPKNEKYVIVDCLKCAVLFFHKNIDKICKKYWVDKCISSVLGQSYQDFDIFEINYGDEDKSILEHFDLGNREHFFYKKNYVNHTEATMYLLEKCFELNNYDLVFNTNVDDYYNLKRFDEQRDDILCGNIINSTLWTYIKENENENDKILTTGHNKFLYKNGFYWYQSENIEDGDYSNEIQYSVIKENLLKNNNVINHSGVCFTKKFWSSYDKFGNLLRYRNDKPFEDISLWIRTVSNNLPVSVVNSNLIYYRIHDNQIGEQMKSKQKNFADAPNLCDYELGIIIDKNNINNINKIETNFITNKKKFYFIFCNIDENILREININKFLIDPSNIDLKNKILENKIVLQLNSDILVYFKDDYKYDDKIERLNNFSNCESFIGNKTDIFIQKFTNV
jgi:hypothetical protein